MLVLLIVFCILSSAGFLYSSVFQRRYEQALPVCITAIVLLLLLCGIVGILPAGVLLVLFLTLGSIVLSVLINIKKKCWKQTASLFFTPGFFIFAAAFLLITFTNAGKPAYEMDAFSHWADVVKSMTILNDFGTNAASLTEFKSYPPGISLFQYLYQRIGCLLSSGFSFNEGYLYHAYQVTLAAFLIPAFKGFTHRKKLLAAVSSVCLFLAPLFLYYYTYNTLMVDTLIGILSASGMTALLLSDADDRFSFLSILSSVIMLVLVKDAGLFFAVILTAGLLLRTWMCSKSTKHSVCRSILSISAAAVPKLLWELQIALSGAERSFSSPVDLSRLFQLLKGSDGGSRGGVLPDFAETFILRGAEMRNIGIDITYFALLLFSFAAIYFLVLYKKRNHPDIRFRNVWFLLLFVQTVLYIIGLLFAYLFKFNDWEAMTLDSFDRYLRIAYQAVFMAIVLLLVHRISVDDEKQTRHAFLLFSLILCTVALGPVVCIFSRENVTNAKEERAVFQPMAEKIETLVPEKDAVFVVEADDDFGYAYRGIRYVLRPMRTQYGSIRTWCLGGPNNSEEVSYSAEEWQKELDQNYNYVAIYRTDDYFLENYSDLFEDPSSLRDESVYLFNHNTKHLELID